MSQYILYKKNPVKIIKYKAICRRKLNNIINHVESFLILSNQKNNKKADMYKNKYKIRSYIHLFISMQVGWRTKKLKFKQMSNNQCRNLIKTIDSINIQEVCNFIQENS